MRQRIVLGVLAIGIAGLYVELLVLTIGVAASLPPPSWWSHVFPTHVSSAILWMVLCHTTAILVVALPFAYLIARLYGRVAVLLALAITFALYAVDPLPTLISHFGGFSARMKVITLVDALKLLGVLPGLVWLFGRMTSNNRFERSRER